MDTPRYWKGRQVGGGAEQSGALNYLGTGSSYDWVGETAMWIGLHHAFVSWGHGWRRGYQN